MAFYGFIHTGAVHARDISIVQATSWFHDHDKKYDLHPGANTVVRAELVWLPGSESETTNDAIIPTQPVQTNVLNVPVSSESDTWSETLPVPSNFSSGEDEFRKVTETMHVHTPTVIPNVKAGVLNLPQQYNLCHFMPDAAGGQNISSSFPGTLIQIKKEPEEISTNLNYNNVIKQETVEENTLVLADDPSTSAEPEICPVSQFLFSTM